MILFCFLICFVSFNCMKRRIKSNKLISNILRKFFFFFKLLNRQNKLTNYQIHKKKIFFWCMCTIIDEHSLLYKLAAAANEHENHLLEDGENYKNVTH